MNLRSYPSVRKMIGLSLALAGKRPLVKTALVSGTSYCL